MDTNLLVDSNEAYIKVGPLIYIYSVAEVLTLNMYDKLLKQGHTHEAAAKVAWEFSSKFYPDAEKQRRKDT